ncbi:hypothetical protein NPS53_09275 [Pseudomonas putida]|uniref:hypothetical protein n=1 Tax=Pseudomonas putida TaxID=303 RepID=UPI0023633289|nr:hypothetical protein [Pseudomonas putida]MDD2139767.1 hypothetical protein [Pseudomonas putida]HDS1721691.1 hypothetical protein [Pseudomonas putida]
MHPAIGQLINGKFYAFIEGHEQQPFEGTLEEVEVAMGLRAPLEPAPASEEVMPAEPNPQQKTFNVTMRFQNPAWNEKDGVPFNGIEANSKREANEEARRLASTNDLLGWGKGRVTFTATEVES